jgi:hypothetical protein
VTSRSFAGDPSAVFRPSFLRVLPLIGGAIGFGVFAIGVGRPLATASGVLLVLMGILGTLEMMTMHIDIDEDHVSRRSLLFKRRVEVGDSLCLSVHDYNPMPGTSNPILSVSSGKESLAIPLYCFKAADRDAMAAALRKLSSQRRRNES